jgi:hypothetical protein
MPAHTHSNSFSELTAYATPALALPAIAFGVAGVLRRGPRVLRRKPWLAGAVACGGLVLLGKSQLDRLWTEEPDYELERVLSGLELRRYRPRVVAETIVETSSFDEAREDGFRRLAGYLFGDNTAKERLSMTIPVNLARRHATTNGHVPKGTAGPPAASNRGYVMRFQMPKERKLASLPRPTDERVTLRRMPPEHVAVLRFRGTYSAERVEDKERELIQRVRALGLTPRGEPTFAGYDAPSALPFLRRVEVWIGVA